MLRRHWRLAALVALQLAILALVPARKILARATGTTVVLRTAPVDPFDQLAGYYVALGYEVEEPPESMEARYRFQSGETVWVIVEEDSPAWRLIALSEGPPPPQEGRVAIRARWNGWRAVLEGAGRFYIPEARRSDVDRAMAREGRRALVEMRVDEAGTPALVRMKVGELSLGP